METTLNIVEFKRNPELRTEIQVTIALQLRRTRLDNLQSRVGTLCELISFLQRKTRKRGEGWAKARAEYAFSERRFSSAAW